MQVSLNDSMTDFIVTVSAWLPTNIAIASESFAVIGNTGGPNVTLQASYERTIGLTDIRGVTTATATPIYTGKFRENTPI